MESILESQVFTSYFQECHVSIVQAFLLLQSSSRSSLSNVVTTVASFSTLRIMFEVQQALLTTFELGPEDEPLQSPLLAQTLRQSGNLTAPLTIPDEEENHLMAEKEDDETTAPSQDHPRAPLIFSSNPSAQFSQRFCLPMPGIILSYLPCPSTPALDSLGLHASSLFIHS